ncbi:MAG: prenyltransferase [Candidatus Njordarchaeia archaeon]
MVSVKDLFIATRPWSFPMTILTITVGAAYAYIVTGFLDIFLYLITLVGSIFLHAFTNLMNDYFDYRYGVDQLNAPTTKYRPHPILTGMMSDKGVLLYALFYGLLGSIIGIFLVLQVGLLVGVIGGIGVLIALSYTGPPFKFKYRALGEVVIFIAFGPTMVLGSFYVQTQMLTLNVLFLSIPIGIMIASVGYANNMRDVDYDVSRGVKTLASLIGDKALMVFKTMVLTAYVSVLLFVFLGFLPLPILLSLLSLPEFIKISKLFNKVIPENADPIVAKLVTNFCLLYLIGILFTPYASLLFKFT